MQPTLGWFEILEGLERATNSGILHDPEIIAKIHEQLRHVREAVKGIPRDDLGSDASRSLIPTKTAREVFLPSLFTAFTLIREDLQGSIDTLCGLVKVLNRAETDLKKLAAAIRKLK